MALPKPPDTDTATPQPPNITPGIPKPVTVLTPLSELKKRGPVSDENLLNHFKADPVNFIREVNLIYNQKERVRLKQLLDKRLSGDKDLFNAWESAKAQLPNLRQSSLVLSQKRPSPQPQPVTPETKEIPEVTAEQLTKQAPEPAPKNDIGPNNAKAIEAWLNKVNTHVHNYYSQSGYSSVSAASSSKTFSMGFLSSLSMYRSELAHFYLTEAKAEMLFSALGPIGDLIRHGYSKKIQWQMNWMKNPLNNNAIYYYLQSLPMKKAFELLYIPAKATFGILASGGAPLISKTTYLETDRTSKNYGKITQGYFFSPTLRGAQFSHSLADSLDKFTGTPTDDDPFRLLGGNSPLEQFVRQKNQDFSDDLALLKIARKKNDKALIAQAHKQIKDHIKKYRGNFFQSIYRKGLINSARRLRNTHHDPFSFLFSLVGGAIWDLFMTMTVRPILTAANRLIELIPGVNTFKAQLTKIFTSNNVLNSITYSGRTFGEILRGTFSPTTFSHGYVGYRAGELLAPNAAISNVWIPGIGLVNLPFAINPVGLITGTALTGWGAFYTSALRLANNPYYFNAAGTGWVQEYNSYLASGNKLAIEKSYLKGFKPGPLSRLADVLHRNWLARLPINGWVAAEFLSPLMERLYGWSSITTHTVFTVADYLWQIKGPVLQRLGTFISNLPAVQRFVASIQFGITFPMQSWWHNLVYKATSFQQSLVGAIPTQWKMRTWAKFGQTFFNPGFFMGFGLIPWFSTFMPTPLAYIAAPVAGSLAWNMTAYALERTFGMRIASMARLNALGWAGYITGSVLQLIFPNFFPPWFSIATSIAFPVGGMIFTALNINLVSLIASGLSSIVSIFSTTAAAAITASSVIAAWAAAISIAAVTGLTIFFAYTIYAGFWVPMIEESRAGPESNNFTISGACTQTGPNQYNCCSNFSVTENVFDGQNFLDHNTDFIRTDLTVDLNDPAATTDAWRGQQLEYKTYVPEWTDGNNYSLVIPPGNMINAAHPYLDAFLPTPTDEPQTFKELMATNSSVVYSMKPFFDILTALAKEHTGAKHLVAEYEAQLKLFETQKELVDALVNNISSGSLSQALQAANRYLNRNPLTDPCPDTTQTCPPEKQGLKSLYDSWEPKITRYITTITNLLAQTDPNLDNFLAQLEQEQVGLKQQIEFLPGIIDQMKDIQKKMTDADAAIINDPGFSFYNFSDEVWRLLSTYFKDIFNENNKFFFIPQGTNYRVCMDMTYTGTLPAEEQTVCSTISYQPSIWGPNTSFAKACTTFTP